MASYVSAFAFYFHIPVDSVSASSPVLIDRHKWLARLWNLQMIGILGPGIHFRVDLWMLWQNPTSYPQMTAIFEIYCVACRHLNLVATT